MHGHDNYPLKPVSSFKNRELGDEYKYPWKQSSLGRRALATLAIVAAVGGSLAAFHDSPSPAPETSHSCTDFDEDILHPPQDGSFGLDPDNFEPAPPHVKKPSDRLEVENIGGITERDGALTSQFRYDVDPGYLATMEAVIADKRVRWAVCQPDAGLSVQTTTGPAGARYISKENDKLNQDRSILELDFTTGDETHLFTRGFDVASALIHESGHAVRDTLLRNGDDERSIAAIKELDDLYAEQLSVALDEYPGSPESTRLTGYFDRLLERFNSSESRMPENTRQNIAQIFAYIKERLSQPKPGAFAELVLSKASDPDARDSNTTRIGSIDDMVARASRALTQEENKRLHGIRGLVTAYLGNADYKEYEQATEYLGEFLEDKFISERRVLPGEKGGHSWRNGDEMFASLWKISGLVDPVHSQKIIDSVPEKYRERAKNQLGLMYNLRETVDPDSLARRSAR